VTFTYLSDLPIDRLLAAVKEARERSPILYLWHSQAGPATTLEPADVLSLIERSASVPIYGPSRSYIGRGSVGGYIFDTSAAATRATEIALQVANGTRADDVAIAEVGSTPMFDSRQLRRWGVRESALPPGSLVLFRPPSFLDEYGRYVAGAVLVFAVETGLIVSLLFQRARRRRAEGAWRVSEARYRAVSETQTELVCRYLRDGSLTFVNDAYCRFWRKTRGQLIGTAFLERVPESRRDEVRRAIESQVERPGAVSHEHEILLPDGSVGWQQWVSHAILDATGHVVELQAVGRDITERKHAEQALRAIGDALRESDERIEDLAGRLIAAQEAERKRIARELHDDLSQKLALLSIDIEQLPRRTQAELSDYVRKISARAAEVATDVHHLAYQLHPSKLESLGLVAAIQGFCRDISRQYDLQVDFEHRHVPQSVPPEIALCLYRIVQEGLHNVVKHSGARQARVELVASDGALDLRIADPGLGFAPSMPGRASIGIGLVGMRERVNIVGGKIAIHTAPGAGTRIGVRVRIDAMRSQTRLTA